jgi:prephenate dehydratase
LGNFSIIKNVAKVSIQGYKGSFHHQVVKLLQFGDEILYRANFNEVFADVVEKRADLAVTAIENSIAGAILENYDRLHKSGLKVIGEYYLRIVMNLIAYPGQSTSDIREVRSHPMALKQCDEFLQANLQIRPVEHADTAQAVEEIMAQKLLGIAGIAGEIAAEVHSAEILQSGIETDPQNFTRFLVLAHHDAEQKLDYPANGKLKTSLYLQTAHKPGALLHALEILERYEANMTMLVSRPVVGQAWHYGFYIDFEHEQPLEQSMLDALKNVAETIQVLGTYRAFRKL